MSDELTVFVVDDDEAMRRSLEWMLSQSGKTVRTFASGTAFLDAYDPQQRGCLVLDVCMPDMTGLELQQELLTRCWPLPVVIVTAHADVAMAVRAMKSDAIDFIEKPFTRDAMLGAIDRALQREPPMRQKCDNQLAFRQHYGRLTPRERQIMQLLVRLEQTKRVAYKLGISKRTADIHRSSILSKMQADSLTELALQIQAAMPELLSQAAG